MVFCPWCGVPKRSDNLERHCNSIHNENASAYKLGEEIKMPEFENWDEVIRLYPSMEGIPKEPRQVWVNQQPR